MNKNILIEIGMTKYEAEIYLALLRNGQISAYELADKVGMYRQVVYDSLNRMIEKGYVSFVKEGKSNFYRAVDPKIILEYLNEKVDNFNEILPDLEGMSSISKNQLIVETHKGRNVTRIALRDIIHELKNGGEVLCTAVDESVPLSNYKHICEQYERDMIHYGIKERVVIREGSKGLFKKGNSKYKKIPKRFFNPNPMQIYGNNVQIIVWGNPDHLIIIRSKEVADAYRKQFEFLWKTAK